MQTVRQALAGEMMPYRLTSCLGNFLHSRARRHGASYRCGSIAPGREPAVDDLISENDGEGFIADQMLRAEHGMPEARGLRIAGRNRNSPGWRYVGFDEAPDSCRCL